MKPLNSFFSFIYTTLRPVFLFLFPVRLEGMDRLPPGGVMLCPNHADNLDPILVALSLPKNYRLHIMAKEELFRHPLLRWALPKLGVFPVSRDSTDIASVRLAMQSIKSGDNLLIFPEGTVIRDGVGYHDGLPAHAKGGAAMIAVRTGAVMVPVFVDGRKRLFRRSRIVFGPPYTPVYTGRRGTAEEMQAIADGVLAAAYALGGQTVGGRPL